MLPPAQPQEKSAAYSREEGVGRSLELFGLKEHHPLRIGNEFRDHSLVASFRGNLAFLHLEKADAATKIDRYIGDLDAFAIGRSNVGFRVESLAARTCEQVGRHGSESILSQRFHHLAVGL